jgi:hypothetical protein
MTQRRKLYIHQIPSKADMGEIDSNELEILSKTEEPYVIVGSAGIYMHLNQEKGTLEILANDNIGGIKRVKRIDLGGLAKHYDAIRDTAEDVNINGNSYKVASLPYLVALNRARKQLPTALIELARSGKVDKTLAEDVRCMLKITDQKEEWTDFLQLLYDFAPNLLD